jgi:DNA polymerase-3 subunit alpha
MSLHVHSEFSSLDGWSTVDEIGDRMLEIGCPFCGLTDHGVVSGHIDFDTAMRKRDLNPVFGAELYHGVEIGKTFKAKERDQHHLIALAMTDEGLRNLWRLVNSTADRAKFHQVGRCSNEDIIKYKEGILFTSACPLGLVPQGLLKGDTGPLNWYLDNLGDNFTVEITTYPGDAQWSDRDNEGATITPQMVNELLVNAAQERGVRITYGDDGHYAFPWQYEYHDMYLAGQTKQSIYTPVDERKQYHPPGAVCIKDEDTVREALSYLPESVVDEAIANTWEIGMQADAHLPTVDRPHMPTFIPKDCPWTDNDDEDATELFIRLVEEGIDRIYKGTDLETEAWERAAREIEVLLEDGLEHYFLMAWDVVRFCDAENIARGPGRGSSAGCIVAYALGITDVDPLYYDLFFERFWNKGRTDGFPDIDSDFARSKRPDIRQYLIDRWGEKRVCSIGTITRMKPIATIEKLSISCGISFEEEREIKNIVGKTKDISIHGTDQIGWDPEIEKYNSDGKPKVIFVKDCVGDEIDEWVGNNEKRRKFIEMCEHACSRNSNYGIHPSGIVVSDIDLDDYAPAYLRGGKAEGIPATLFPMKTIDILKLLKLDVLGLRTLDTLSEWEDQMREQGIDFDWSGLDREEYPDEMWDLLEEGFVAGIFQIETPSGKILTEKLKPRSVEDLGILVALNRPGPLRDGIPNKYVARREGREPVVYPHPMLEEILKPTYGLFVYQEQIIRFMWELGYSLGDADAVRKILGKKQPEKLSEIFEGFKDWDKKGFLEVAMSKGFSKEIATEVWKGIEGFASYSFNKSHSIAYGIIAFRCLFAKYYGMSEFYIACIRTIESQKRKELMPQYIKEARRKKISILPPDIRYSKGRISKVDEDVYFGFGDVSGVGSAGDYLLYLRDELEYDISSPDTMVAQLEHDNDYALKEKKQRLKDGDPFPSDWKSPKQQITSNKIVAIYEAGAWDGLEEREVSLREKQELEEKFLSVILTDNSEEVIANNLDEIEACDGYQEACMSWAEAEELYDWVDDSGEETPPGKRYLEYTLPGIITDIRPTKVRSSGAAMGIVTIEYDGDELTFAVFSDNWKKSKFLFKPRQMGIFTVRHTAPNDKRNEGYHFRSGHLLT